MLDVNERQGQDFFKIIRVNLLTIHKTKKIIEGLLVYKNVEAVFGDAVVHLFALRVERKSKLVYPFRMD